MRKTFALAAAVIGMVGAFAAAPGAAASAVNPSAPSPVVTGTQHNLSAGTDVRGATSVSAAIWYKNFVNWNSGTCLDDSSASGLRMHGCSDASYNNGYQKWRVYYDGGGSYQFMNVKTGLCLDGSSNYGVRTHACSDASYNNGYQQWKLYYDGGGTWVSWANKATGQCMDYSSAGGLRLHTCSVASWNNGYQAWNW